MKALVLSLAGLFLSHAAYAAGCSEAEARRLVLERIVHRAEGTDFSEVKIHVEKTRAGTRQYPINSMYATYIIPGPGGTNTYGWVNAEIQPRNPCFHSGESATNDNSYLRGTVPNVQLNDYLRDHQMGTLMRGHTPRQDASNDSPTPSPAAIQPPSPTPAVAPADEDGSSGE